MRRAINWLSAQAVPKRVYCKKSNKSYYFKINFITLTFPHTNGAEIHGKIVSKCLHTWLIYARKYFYLHNYVWKIERGVKGNLHIHLTSDTYVDYRKLRDSWNRILIKNGLIDEHFKKFNEYDPNSTDVHAVRDVDNLAGYMASYMTKKSNLGEDFTGRIWGCSRELSDKNKCQYIADVGELTSVAAPLMNPEIEWKPIETEPDMMGNRKRIGEIYFIKAHYWSSLMYGKLKQTYINHLYTLRNKAPQIPINYLIQEDYDSKLDAVWNKKRGYDEKIFRNLELTSINN